MNSTGINSLSELVISAVFYLQQKNGVDTFQIAEYVGKKRRCNPCKLRRPIRSILLKAKQYGILCESKGMFRIESKYEDDFQMIKPKPKQEEGENREAGDQPKPEEESEKEESCEDEEEEEDEEEDEDDEDKSCSEDEDDDGEGDDQARTCSEEDDLEDEEDEDDDDDDGKDCSEDDEEAGKNYPDRVYDMKEPLPKKRKLNRDNQEDSGGEMVDTP